MITAKEQIPAFRKIWEKIAEKSLEIEAICGTLYAFTDELSALRLYTFYAKIAPSPEWLQRINADHSKNADTWYFRYEL